MIVLALAKHNTIKAEETMEKAASLPSCGESLNPLEALSLLLWLWVSTLVE